MKGVIILIGVGEKRSILEHSARELSFEERMKILIVTCVGYGLLILMRF